MLVSELIVKLQQLPQDAEIVKSSSDGCNECNPEGFEIYHSIFSSCVEYLEEGDYPNKKTHIVIL